MKNLNLLNYSAKCVVVYGDGTKDHKTELKQMGGKWNSHLKHPQTGETFGGWIYPTKKENDLKAFINANAKEVESNELAYIDGALIDAYTGAK